MHTIKTNRIAFVRVLLIGLATSCGGAGTDGVVVPPPPPAFVPVPTTVSFALSKQSINAGDTLSLTATVFDQKEAVIAGANVNFVSADTNVASIVNKSLIVGKAGGAVSVTANSGSVSSAAQLLTVLATARTTSWASIDGGTFHSCGLSTTHIIYCWGANDRGQLGSRVSTTCMGTASYPCSVKPARVNSTQTFDAVYTGNYTSCGLTASGAAYCWGLNYSDNLALGTTDTVVYTPTPVVGGLRFTTLAMALDHTCGLASDGTAYCWGNNYTGELGVGNLNTTSYPTPTAVVGGHKFISISTRDNTTCGVATTHESYCWGAVFLNSTSGVDYGTIYASPTLNRKDSGDYNQFATTNAGICGLHASGQISCFGSNRTGVFGDGTITGDTLPHTAQGGGYTNISAGGFHLCALRGTTAYCWGDNTFYALGVGTASTTNCKDLSGNTQLNCTPTPQMVVGGLSFKILRGGTTHTCAITTNNEAYCWGNNNANQLGSTTQNPGYPQKVDEPIN
jgi:alpha-tubulin suppressor-like RCC1 family protein